MISYGKLWMLLKSKGMKKADLLEVISAPTLAKLGKNENINVSMIEKICAFLDCQPGEIMEYVNEEKVKKVVEQFGYMKQVMVDSFKEKGISKEEFISLMNQALPQYMEAMYNGKNPLENIMHQAISQNENND